MSSKDQNLSQSAQEDIQDASPYKFGIIVSDWNADITHKLMEGAMETLQQKGAKENNIFVHHVPGTFELPLGARLLLGKENVDAVICIGCVIKGETEHDVYINTAVAQGIMNLGLTSSKPIIFGVLTPNTKEQAEDRAGGKYGNKGVEAATTAIKMVHLAKEVKSLKKGIGFN